MLRLSVLIACCFIFLPISILEGQSREILDQSPSSSLTASEPSDRLLVSPDSTQNIDNLKDTTLASKLSNIPTIATTFTGAYLLLLVDQGSSIDRSLANKVGVGLTGAGLITGPSIGHFYAGDEWQALKGIGLRSAGIAASTGGYYLFLSCAFRGAFVGSDCSVGTGILGAVSFFGGIGLTLGNAIHDMSTADKSARAYNRKHNPEISLSITPYYDPASRTRGLTLKISF